MKLSDYRQVYYEFSGKASEIARNLAFAGIALIWVFRVGETAPRVPEPLLLPAVALVAGLTFDLIHYVWATVAWGTFHRYHEKRATERDPELDAPAWINRVTTTFFVAKLLSVSTAYVFILLYAWGQWMTR